MRVIVFCLVMASAPPRLVHLDGEQVSGALAPGPVRLSWSRDTYLAQVSPALARLRDVGAQVELAARGGSRSMPVQLRDEEELRRWLDAPGPGKLRVVQRADGLELQTAVGKLPGPDRNGPTLPSRAGRLDREGLGKAIEALRRRFGNADGVWVVPSFGTPLDAIAETVGALQSEGEPLFAYTALVFPRPYPGGQSAGAASQETRR